jgi:very-short-patch-repair endonuclease
MSFDLSAQIETWRSQLLDTTKRNRLINFKTGRTGGIPLVYPEAGDLWSRLVLNNASLAFAWKRDLIDLPTDAGEPDETGTLALFDPSDVPEKEAGPDVMERCLHSPRLRPNHLLTELTDSRLAARLTRLALNAHEALTEQGVAILYVAFGFLRWFETLRSEVEIRSPLLLVPVRLERDSVESPWKLQVEEEEVLPNHSLVQMLDRDFRLRLPVPEDETADENDPIWRISYFSEVLDAVQGHDSRWEVLDEVALGTFSFQKLAMWEDLGQNRERIASHALCRAIANDPAASLGDPPDLPTARELDQVAQPARTFHILDADSSQHEAIEAVKRGASLVLDGPPGTGKSQTIANIIAEFLAVGKSVLFVSEKAAALEVVQRRLQDKGLDDFCLACHSHKANKREVVAELGRCLSLERERPRDPVKDLHQLDEVRRQLNDYVRELHENRPPLGMSVYQVQGQLAGLVHLTSRSRCPIPRVLERDAAYLRHTVELLARLPDCQAVIAEGGQHPWRGCQARLYSPTLRDDAQYHFGRLAEGLSRILEAVTRLGRLGFAGEQPTRGDWLHSVENARKILRSSFWWDPIQREELLGLLTRWVDCDRTARALHRELSPRLWPWAFESDSAPLVARACRYRAFWARLLPSWWWSIKPKVRTWYRQGLLSTQDLLDDLQKLAEYHQCITFCEHLPAEHAADLLIDANGDLTCTGTLTVLETIDGPEKASALRDGLAEVVRLSEQVLADGFAESWQFLATLFDPTLEVSTGITIDQAPLAELQPWLADRAGDPERIYEWLQFTEIEQDIDRAEASPLLAEVLRGEVKPEEAGGAFRARFLSLWLDRVQEGVPALRRFATDSHERLIERFRELDRQAIATGARRIRARQLSRRDRPRMLAGEPPGSSELGILLRELHKKRRHLPLRKLFAVLPNLLLRLKPCVMMSPLAVSTYLNTPDIHFDLVIFDEASQVRPHDAICAIYRGQQLLVAGDQKQLPPTSFFDRVLQDTEPSSEEEQDGLENYESILDVCCKLGMLRRRLRWHYRSRREGLIAFSNRFIYDNELVTFPSVHDVAGNPAVAFEYVADGRWKPGPSGGFNAVEARRTAELVMEHFQQYPDESLGVIAFSQRQQMRILDELEQLRMANPDLEEFFREDRDEPFFVKNLENVQGDERAVIFLGIGYGPDDTGRVAMRFGPLNRQGGERRLNVAVTRARRRMLVISSMHAHDIDLSRSSAEAVKLLRAYLDYAERGTEALPGVIRATGEVTFDSPFEQEVYEELGRQGLTMQTQVGCSGFRVDLAVVDPRVPGRYLLGVECDGATYHSSATARDRDRLRQEVLESLGWWICRVWSTDWVRDRDGQVRRVLSALEKAQHEEPTPDREPARPQPPVSREIPPPVEPTPPIVRAREGAVPDYRSIDAVPAKVLQETILNTLRSCGATEEKELIPAVARELGFKRTGNRIQARIKEAMARLVRSGSLGRTEDGRVQIIPDGRAKIG